MEGCIHKCLSTSCQCIIAVSMPMASSLSVCHNSGIVAFQVRLCAFSGGRGGGYLPNARHWASTTK